MPIETAPSPLLVGRVDAFWEHSGGARTLRILPDGAIDFVFDLDAGTARLVGAMTTARLVEVPAGKRMFGVRFLPGAAAPYLDGQASEFVDERLELADVTARSSGLADRIANARDRSERERLLAEHLLDPRTRVRRFDPRVRRAARLIAAQNGAVTLAELSAVADVGERQLERLFYAHVGLGPKHCARIARLTHACRLLARADLGERQATLAAAAGYADESHLLREFRELSGVTPAVLRAERHPLTSAG